MFIGNIEKLTKENTNFRKVLFTGKHCQIVAMSIPVGEEIGEEVHAETDQAIFIFDGEAEAVIQAESYNLQEDGLILVQAGSVHNLKNIGTEDLKICTIYSPALHEEGTVHRTRAEANMSEHNEL